MTLTHQPLGPLQIKDWLKEAARVARMQEPHLLQHTEPRELFTTAFFRYEDYVHGSAHASLPSDSQQFDPTQRQERHQEQSSDSALSDRVRHSKIDALQDALVDVDLRFL